VFDGTGYPSETRDVNGMSMRFTYDKHGDLTERVDEQGNTTRFNRDSIGRLSGIVDTRGASIHYTYDNRNNPVTVTGPGFSSNYRYDALGRIVSAEDSLGRTAYSYSPEGRLTEERRDDGKCMRYQYDAAGNIVRIEDGTGRFAGFEYDGNNRIASVSDNVGVRFRLQYDRAGNLVKRVDSSGGEEIFLYDRANHLKAYIDQAGHRLDIRTDWAGLIVGRKDELGQEIVRGYDGDGNLTEQRDTAGRFLRHVYEPLGQLALTIDGNGRMGEFLHDVAGRLTETRQGDRSVQVLYDTFGRPAEITDPAYPIRMGYDEQGILCEFRFAGGISVTSSYDKEKLRTALRGPGDYHVRYAYDERRRIRVIEAFNGASVRFSYDAQGRRSEQVFGNGVTARYVYDGLGRVSELTYRNRDGSVLYHYRVLHDVNRRISAMAQKGSDVRFLYDPVGRLKDISDSEGRSKTLTYDAAGNRMIEQSVDRSAKRVEIPYAYGAGHRLMRRGGTVYRYDEEGNRTAKESDGGVTRYVYGAGNRLLRVELPGDPPVEFRYDFFGNRIERKQGRSVERYIYNGMDLIGAYDEFMRPRMEIVYGPAVDEPLFSREKGRVSYFILDPLGNVVATVDEKGNAGHHVLTDAFGNVRMAKPVPAIALAFQGRPYDEATGLYHFRNRDYDPVTGRFLQPDPVEPGTNLNLYTFADNDPVNYADPTGLSPVSKYEESLKRYVQTRNSLANTETYIRKLRAQESSASPADRRRFQDAGGQRELARAQHAWGERKTDFDTARRDLAVAGSKLPQKSSIEVYVGLESTLGLKKYTIKSTNGGSLEIWVQDTRGYSPLDVIAGVSWGESRQTLTGAKGFGNFGGSVDVNPRTGKMTGIEASYSIAPAVIPQVQLPGNTSVEYAPKPAKKIGDVKAKDFLHTISETVGHARNMLNPFRLTNKACKTRPKQGGKHR
jgi:RHS repeat-associated protein